MLLGFSHQTKKPILPAVQEACSVVTEGKVGRDGVDAYGSLSLTKVKFGTSENTDEYRFVLRYCSKA